MTADRAGKGFPHFSVRRSRETPGEIEIVPADDAVSDRPVARFGDLQFFLHGLAELARVPDGDGAGEAVRQLDLVELPFDGPAQVEIIDVAQDEQRLDDLSEGFERLVERVLPRRKGRTRNGRG